MKNVLRDSLFLRHDESTHPVLSEGLTCGDVASILGTAVLDERFSASATGESGSAVRDVSCSASS